MASGRRCYHFITLLAVCVIEIVADSFEYDGSSTHHRHSRFGLEPVCVDTLCYSQEDCCSGAACITHGTSKIGVCVKYLGQPEGKLCTIAAPDEQCAGVMECRPIHANVLPLGVCINPHKMALHKKYFESCETTAECDMNSKLCCRFQTPGRGKNRKICSYYDAPLEQCIF